MTRQEAERVLFEVALFFDRRGEEKDAQRVREAYMFFAEQKPTPDPETGLVPCGCGGKAGFHYSVMMRDNDCYVECGICGGHTKVVLSEDKARDAWNTAMGWKGGAE